VINFVHRTPRKKGYWLGQANGLIDLRDATGLSRRQNGGKDLKQTIATIDCAVELQLASTTRLQSVVFSIQSLARTFHRPLRVQQRDRLVGQIET
jgi:hypothetical protein